MQNTIEKAVILSERTSLEAEDLSLEKKTTSKADMFEVTSLNDFLQDETALTYDNSRVRPVRQ